MEVYSMTEIHPDKESYEKIWNDLINKEIRNYQEKYLECIQLIPNAKEEIWEKYCSLNKYCKMNYMKSPEGKIDRHKVAACYLIAISSVKPMRFVERSQNFDKSIYFVLNERLSITVAFSLLRAFTIAAIYDNEKVEEDVKNVLVAKFEDGILIPDKNLINHGVYVDNFASEIHYAVSEGNINILSIAHELFLLEVITRIGK